MEEEIDVNYCLARSNAVKNILTRAKVKPNPYKIGSKKFYIIDIDDAKKLREDGFLLTKTGNTETENVFFANVSKCRRAPIRRPRKAECSEDSRKTYVNFLIQGLTSERERTKEEVKEAQENVVKYRKAVVASLRSLERNSIALSNIEKSLGEGRKKFEREFDALLATPKVTSVKITDSKIEIRTETLYCVDPRNDVEHEIGKFKIVIENPFEDDNSCVWIHNSSRQVSTENYPEMHAPHVFENGEPCWGNIEDTVSDLLSKIDLGMLVQIILQFLQNCNVNDSAGVGINKWPVSKRSARVQAMARPVRLDENTVRKMQMTAAAARR